MDTHCYGASSENPQHYVFIEKEEKYYVGTANHIEYIYKQTLPSRYPNKAAGICSALGFCCFVSRNNNRFSLPFGPQYQDTSKS